MRASIGIALLTILGCLPSATAQAKDDPCSNLKSDREVQECRANQAEAIKEASELRSALESGNGGTAANDPTSADLRYNVHMSDCENQWVALYHNPNDHDYTYGFVYIDPQAGFTLQYSGHFTIDSNGDYHESPSPLPSNKFNLKIRLQGQNSIAALLPPRALAQLGLPDMPDWLKFYEDKADPVTHKISWGFFYNDIGDPRRAIDYLESAYSEKPDAPRVVFELTFAYNAVGRPADAIRVSKNEFAKNPKNELLCREIAFAYLTLKSYKEATEQYPACIALLDDSEGARAEKSELAINLSAAYERMGDTQNHDVWVNKARDWAPKGSPVYNSFHP